MEEMNNIYEAEVNEVTDLVPIEVEEEEAGMSTGMAMAIGAVGGVLIIKLGEKVIEGGKKLWAKHKAKKASESADENVIEAEFEACEEEVPVNA